MALELIIKKSLTYILDTIAPPDPEVRKIENMTPRDFIYEASKTLRPRAIDGVFAFFAYRNPVVQTAIIDVKSYANKRLAKLLGNVLWEMLVTEFVELPLCRDLKNPLLLAIPITRTKKRERGCNQCELILDMVKKKITERPEPPVTFEIRSDVIIKIRETADQVGKNRTERFENQKGCFAVTDAQAIKDRDVIVFDDIVTTGATLFEARQVLLSAGARKVICLAFAH